MPHFSHFQDKTKSECVLQEDLDQPVHHLFEYKIIYFLCTRQHLRGAMQKPTKWNKHSAKTDQTEKPQFSMSA